MNTQACALHLYWHVSNSTIKLHVPLAKAVIASFPGCVCGLGMRLCKSIILHHGFALKCRLTVHKYSS